MAPGALNVLRSTGRAPSWFRPLHRCPYHHRRFYSTDSAHHAAADSSAGSSNKSQQAYGVFGTLYPSGSPTSPLKVVESSHGPPVPWQDRAKELPPSHRRLPKPPNHAPLFIGTFLTAVTLWGLFIYHATNSERANSSVVRSILFHLRTSPVAVEALGRGVKGEKGKLLDTLWVDGNINMMQGSVDLAFRVKGDKAAGKIFFTSVRRTKSSRFEIVRWRIIRDDGVVFDLRQELTSRLTSPAAAASVIPDTDAVVSIDFESADDPFALASASAPSTLAPLSPAPLDQPAPSSSVQAGRLV